MRFLCDGLRPMIDGKIKADHLKHLMGVEMVQLYTEGDPEMIDRARKGVLDYMDIYGRFFAELSDAMFGQRAYLRGAKAS